MYRCGCLGEHSGSEDQVCGARSVPWGSVAVCLAVRPQVLHFVRFTFDERAEVE